MPHRSDSLQGRGFNFTQHVRQLCEAMVRDSMQLGHVDMDRVAISFARARKAGAHGTWATLTPLRFENGSRVELRYGRRVTCQRLLDQRGTEMLYILSFYLPRFLDLALNDKIATIFHELWHISPQFNGDVRRFPGRCFAHTGSEKQYHAAMHAMAQEWLARRTVPDLILPFVGTFREIQRQFGPVYGVKIAQPRIIPCDAC